MSSCTRRTFYLFDKCTKNWEAKSSIEDLTIGHMFNFGSSIQQHSDSTHVLTVCCGPNGTSTLKISIMISDITDIYWSVSNGKQEDSKLEIRYGLKNYFQQLDFVELLSHARTRYDSNLGPGTVVILRIHLGSSIQQHLNKWNLTIGWSSEQRRPTWRDANINGTLMFSSCVKWQRMMMTCATCQVLVPPTNMCIESYLQDIA